MTSTDRLPIQWQKLLGRAPARLGSRVFDLIEGTTVFITGAGGSIGSALTKAVLDCGAEKVVLLDSSEQALYRATSELALCKRAVPILGSILDEHLLDDIFDRFGPAIVFHTAAFKHLPLLEGQPFAAIENNTMGTYILARAAEKFRIGRLIAVSTDKAVNATSIMGVSKRLGELVVASYAKSHTRMSTVRLGNVLGSDGSVARRFIEQIERGGPVTVTDPAATRYFFTLEETVNIILAGSGVEAEDAIVVPRETEPMSVIALAEFLIRALNADVDLVRIEYTGLCPGEKLTEQLCYEYEQENAKQLDGYRVISSPVECSALDTMIVDLRLAIRERDFDLLLQTVWRFIPEYAPSTTVQQLAAASLPRPQ